MSRYACPDCLATLPKAPKIGRDGRCKTCRLAFKRKGKDYR